MVKAFVLPLPVARCTMKIREAIREVVPPDATEIISYKIPACRHKKVLVWYTAFAKHHFPLDKPMPVELRARVESEGKKNS